MSTNDPSMDDLVARSVNGDRQALERLLLACSTIVLQRISKRLKAQAADQEDLQDILQQTYFSAVYCIGTLRQHDFLSFRTWLLRVADNCVVDFLRHAKAQKRGNRVERSLIELDDLTGHTSHPSKRLHREEVAGGMKHALNELPSDQRRAVALRWLEGRSVATIARAMHRSPEAVRSLVKRGLQRLRAIFGSGSKWFNG
jgi:RNA polymerase sigma-70 factor (ECF subfamily)